MTRRLAPLGVALVIMAAVVCALSGCSGVDETSGTTSADAVDDPDTSPLDASSDELEVLSDSDGLVETETSTEVAGWQLESLGDEGILEVIWCVSGNEAYTVGGNRVLRYNGSTWATYGAPPDQELHGVSSDGVATVIVGDGGFIARRLAGDMSWTQEESGTDRNLYGVFGYSSDDLWAVGGGSTVLHYVDGAWTQESSGGSVDLQSVWVPPSGDIEGAIAAGTGGIIYKRHNGQWVTEQVADGSATLHAVWGAGAARYAVGTAVGDGVTISGKEDALSPWDGHNANLNKVKDLHGLTTAQGEVWAVGHGGTMLRFTGGKTWSVVSLAGLYNAVSPLEDISAAGGGPGQDLLWMAISADGGGLRYDGVAWRDMDTKPSDGLRAMAGPSRDQLWAVGEEGLILTMTDVGWTAVPSGTLEDLNDVSVASDGTVWIAGEGGTLLRVSSDGEVETVAVPAPGNLLSVSATDDGVIVGAQGGIVLKGTPEGEDFSVWPVGAAGDVRAIEPDGAGGWWLGGAFGLLSHVAQGEAVGTSIAVPTSGTLYDVAVDGERVVAVGDNGVIVEVLDGEVNLLHEDPGLFLYGVSSGGGQTWVVGWNGTTLREDTDGFVLEDSGTDAVLEAVWHDDAGAFAAGRLGSVLVWTEAP